ncbi:hypothetical protein PGTUg99_004493 [Puccinia graminis f. sp. tritici]|uniref:Uncharacterized protein n=1 Tax=Puccinia graminis f. sp. tritici TaxID=56615 RepID=A0A5B0RD41_PUCGR|nr:hypothetical protein PGTUg99_004493 [Puccinia graminis f. sp. tritici]
MAPGTLLWSIPRKEANSQESAADSQASSHSSDLVDGTINPVTTKNHQQSPKSALPPGELPTTEHAKSAPIGPKSTSISTSSTATSGDPSDDSAALQTDKTLELTSDPPAVQCHTSQPPPSTNVPPKQATTPHESIDKTVQLPSDSPAVQHRTSQPPPSTNVPPKQATTDHERVEETLELSSNSLDIQNCTSQHPPSNNVPPKQATAAADHQSMPIPKESIIEKSANLGTSGPDLANCRADETPNLPKNPSKAATVSNSPKESSAPLPAPRPDVELLKSAIGGLSGADLATQRADETLDPSEAEIATNSHNASSAPGTSGADSATQRADNTLNLPLDPSGTTTAPNSQNASSDETLNLPDNASEATTVSNSSKASSAPLPAPRPDVELLKLANGGLSGADLATQRADETPES